MEFYNRMSGMRPRDMYNERAELDWGNGRIESFLIKICMLCNKYFSI